MNDPETNALIQYIFDTDVAETAVSAACKAQLHHYIEAELAGQNAALRFPQVNKCIQENAEFRQAYTELRQLLQQEQDGRLAEPPRTFSLSDTFWQSVSANTVSAPAAKQYWLQWHLTDLGNLVVRIRSKLRDMAQDSAESVAQSIQPTPDPKFILAGELRSAADQLPQFHLKGAVDDIDVEIAAEMGDKMQQRCQIVVKVDIPSRGGWPNLADTQVILQHHTNEIAVGYTDAYGVVRFTDISVQNLDDLRVEISPASQ